MKYEGFKPLEYRDRSRPAWGAWIEIYWSVFSRHARVVAPRVGRVD